MNLVVRCLTRIIVCLRSKRLGTTPQGLHKAVLEEDPSILAKKLSWDNSHQRGKVMRHGPINGESISSIGGHLNISPNTFLQLSDQNDGCAGLLVQGTVV